MQFRRLGKTDIQVSAVGLGGNTFGPPRLDQATSIACIHHAESLGVNFIDTAAIYGEGHSESFIGEALHDRRSAWVVATKFNFWRMAADERPAQRIRRQCEESLRKLRTDYIDLYQMHAPVPGVSIDEVLETLATLVHEGKVRYVGACNFAAWRHMQALEKGRQNGWPRMVTSQNHYNLVRRHVELETLPFCAAEEVAFLPYHPLAGGFLTDKYSKHQPPPPGTRGAAGSPIIKRSRTAHNEEVQDQLKTWAHAQGHSLGELAIAWLLHCPQVASVIAGVSSTAQVEANVKGGDWQLTSAQFEAVDVITRWEGSQEVIEQYINF
jgi:aryl-alcohol dehydrogenase-like predicted oxidoreductase